MASCAQALSSSSLSRSPGALLGSSRLTLCTRGVFSPVCVSMRKGFRGRSFCVIRASVTGNGVVCVRGSGRKNLIRNGDEFWVSERV